METRNKYVFSLDTNFFSICSILFYFLCFIFDYKINARYIILNRTFKTKSSLFLVSLFHLKLLRSILINTHYKIVLDKNDNYRNDVIYDRSVIAYHQRTTVSSRCTQSELKFLFCFLSTISVYLHEYIRVITSLNVNFSTDVDEYNRNELKMISRLHPLA